MAAGKTKRNLDEIDDIGEMFEVMKALDISSKGLKSLEDMKERVKTNIGEASKSTSWNAGQAFSILSDVHDEDVRKRRVLWNLYTEAEETIAKLDPTIGNPLEQNVGNVKEKMKNYKMQLERKEYFVLVAGETGSGKSSLVNLILGEDLLPFSVLSTTSTICELKYGEERKIVAHFKNEDPETGHPTKTIPLKECRGESSEQSYLQQIAPYVHVINGREEGSIYKRIELFWPHPLLKKGIVIIDSPGVGESDIMDAIVKQYLPQAFAFLYVINSANAGGVQKDRLEKLLVEVTEEALKRQGELPTKCALFVCNKWDQVPETEVEAVKDHVITKLTRCWKNVDPESQIVYMSSQKASKAQNIGIITEEFSTLMNGLKLMVLKSIGESLEIQWKFLDQVLSRIVYQAKAFVMNASRDRNIFDQQIREIVDRLNLIEQQQIGVVAHLHQYLEKQVNRAFRELLKYFSSKEVKARFTSWTLDEVPRSEDTWEVTRNQITKLLSRRFREFTEQWEEDNKVFANARVSLLQHFQSRYHFVEGQLRSLQSAITAGKKDVPENLTELDGLDLSLSGKVIIGVTSPIWVPLGLVAFVIGAPVYGIFAFKSKLVDKKKLKTYKKDKCAFMREMSADYLEEVIEEKSLKPFVKEQMKEAQVCLKQIEARLPELIQADKMLYNQLRAETRSKEEITERYQPIVDEASLVRGRLAVFGFEEVQATHIEAENLTWSEDTSSHLGRGAFANVYIGKMERSENSNLTVALKVYNEVLDAKNASQFMGEVQILRKLSHRHIVKFYGPSLLRKEKENTVRIILVFEWCKGNLKNHIFNNQELIPGKSGRREAIEKVCQWIKEITEALAYIHEQGIVHRDLKLENVLLSEDNSVRVSDVGISKEAIEITGTIAGSPVYIAPEVFQSELYDSKADIYSLGIILWEVWYGEHAFSKILKSTPQQFFSFVANGERPKPLEGYSKPLWEVLMKQCWEANPQNRPTAEECLKTISGLGG